MRFIHINVCNEWFIDIMLISFSCAVDYNEEDDIIRRDNCDNFERIKVY